MMLSDRVASAIVDFTACMKLLEREPMGGRHALSTLPRTFDCRSNERHAWGRSGIRLALPALWFGD
jgi:hypothetical protein